MARLKFEGIEIEATEDVDVLSALLQAGANVAFSCRIGVCQSCMLRSVKGDVPKEAQTGLRDSQISENFFLACQCVPSNDIEIERPYTTQHFLEGIVSSVDDMADGMRRLRIDAELAYRAGQYVTLWVDGQTGHRCSLASLPEANSPLEFHVKPVAGDRFSDWVTRDVNIGDTVRLQGPVGATFYVPGHTQQPIILAGTGSGLPAIYGILRDALQNAHQGDIHFLAEAQDEKDLYLRSLLSELDDGQNRFKFHHIVRPDLAEGPGIYQGAMADFIEDEFGTLAGWRSFICGDPPAVERIKKEIFLAGASLNEIHSDPYYQIGNPPGHIPSMSDSAS